MSRDHKAAVNSVSLFSLSMVCDYALDELSGQSSVEGHYSNLPSTKHQSASQTVQTWMSIEDGRLRRYVSLLASMLRYELLKASREHAKPSDASEVPDSPSLKDTCTLYSDLLQHCFDSWPAGLLHHFLYSCALGMNISVETLSISFVLFVRIMLERDSRDHFLRLRNLPNFACAKCVGTSLRSPSLSSLSSYQSTPPSPSLLHESIFRPTSKSADPYGAADMWNSLGTQLRSAYHARPTSGCGCFADLPQSTVSSLQWSVFEGVVAGMMGTMCVATKIYEDTLWANRCWSKMSGFSTATVNQTEIDIVTALRFNCFVNREQYSQCLASFCNRYRMHSMSRSLPARPKASSSHNCLPQLVAPDHRAGGDKDTTVVELLDRERNWVSGNVKPSVLSRKHSVPGFSSQRSAVDVFPEPNPVAGSHTKTVKKSGLRSFWSSITPDLIADAASDEIAVSISTD